MNTNEGMDAYFTPNTQEEKDNTKEFKIEKPLRRPYIPWTVKGEEVKLKLTTDAITKVEGKYGKNLMFLVIDDGLPAVSVILDIIQAAAQKYNHGITAMKIKELYDDYVEEGGAVQTLLAEVIYPLLGNGGFFTPAQEEEMIKMIEQSL